MGLKDSRWFTPEKSRIRPGVSWEKGEGTRKSFSWRAGPPLRVVRNKESSYFSRVVLKGVSYLVKGRRPARHGDKASFARGNSSLKALPKREECQLRELIRLPDVGSEESKNLVRLAAIKLTETEKGEGEGG